MTKALYLRLLAFTLLLLCVGCHPKQQMPPEARFFDAAERIVADPSNWKNNSQNLAEFTRLSVDLGWDDESEVKDFKAGVLDLIVFSTTWIDKLDRAEREKLEQGLTKIVASASANLVGTTNAPEIRIESQNYRHQAEELIASTTHKLSGEQSAAFSKVYGRVVDSYEHLYKFGRTGPNHALQRTAPAVTLDYSAAALPPTVQPARQLRRR